MIKLPKIKFMSMEFILVITTIDDYLKAHQISKVLVTEKLAACCTILQTATSLYEWEGKLEERMENVILIKTTQEKFSQLKNRICELHTDKVPEIISLKIDSGLEEYLNWVREATK